MAEVVQLATINELLGRCIEDSVKRAVAEQVEAALGNGVQRACDEVQTRIHKMVESALRSLTVEGERIIEHTCERIVEATNKAMDEMPVTIQESLMEMTKENETLFRRRAAEWVVEMHEEAQAGLDAVRKKFLEETGAAAKATCDRNLFDYRSEFENHVNRCFQGVAERLSAPITIMRQ
jgi:methionyl-tRNA synthetase